LKYTKRTVVVSQSRVSEAEQRVARQRQVVDRLQTTRHPAEHAIALLLVMEQSLLSMRRFLSTLERDLEISLGEDKPQRKKISRYREKAVTDQMAQHVVDALRDGGIAGAVASATGAVPEIPARTEGAEQPSVGATDRNARR
jgi:hypothetical protein